MGEIGSLFDGHFEFIWHQLGVYLVSIWSVFGIYLEFIGHTRYSASLQT